MLERFFKDRRTHDVLLAFLLLSSAMAFPDHLAQADETLPPTPLIPVEPAKISFGKGESDAITGDSLEQIISEAYKIPADELITKTPAILRTETNGKEDPENPMQIIPETAAESLKDFELKVGMEKFNEMTANMSPQQKNIFVGQITFARYFQMAQHSFDKFPEKTRKDLALVYYNRGPGITNKIIAFWAANNPETDFNISWRNIVKFLRANSEKVDIALKFEPGKTREFTVFADTYVWRVNLLSDPNVPRETVFTKK